MPSRKCVTNFCNEGKVMVLLSMVRYQVLLCFSTHDTDAIAMNKLCKLYYHVLSYKSATGLSGLL